jgi:hypothetical protein
MTRLCDLDWKDGRDPYWNWHTATLPGNVKIYRAKPEHPSMARLYQIDAQRSPFRTPPSGQCWDALTAQCWLSAYMQWWKAEGKHGPALRS